MDAKLKTLIDGRGETLTYKEVKIATQHYHLYVTDDYNSQLCGKFKAVVNLIDSLRPKGGWKVDIYRHPGGESGVLSKSFEQKYWTKKSAYQDAVEYLCYLHRNENLYGSKSESDGLSPVCIDCEFRNNCGPTTLSAITGMTLSKSHEQLQTHGHHVPGRRTNMHDLKAALEQNGFHVEFERQHIKQRTGVSYVKPTMAQWLEENPPGLYAVSNGSHVCAIHIRADGNHKWVDNGCWSYYPYHPVRIDFLPKRVRVKRVLKIT